MTAAPSSTKRVRAARWLRGSGIEIGALNAPLQVPAGADVRYVDRSPVDVLRRQYVELEGEELVPVSIIGDAQDLSGLGDSSVDFVVANHLVEHLEDPIAGLAEMSRVLRTGGILYLALPDPRVTFDVDRELTSVAHVIDEYRNGTAATRRAHFEEWVAAAEPHVEWMQKAGVGTGPARVDQLMEMDYSIHFHVWRPDTFLELLVAASREARLEFELLDFHPRWPQDNEYIFVLRKGIDGGSGPVVPRLPEETIIENLQEELTVLRQRSEAVERELRAAQDSLEAVTRSRSWRLTAPLRALTAARRGRGQR